MKVCFPVQHDDGLESAVFNHFGSAPLFLVVDIETEGVTAVGNRDQHHAHGSCNPLKALDQQKVDAVIVGGIGAGALTRLNQAGVRVFRAESGSVRRNLMRYREQGLSEYTVQGSCGHNHGGGCSHH